EIERALVHRAPGDGAHDALGLDRAQILDILEVGDAAAGNHRYRQLARQCDSGLDVDAGQHAVTADIGVDHRLDAVILEFLCEVNDIVAGHFRPAVDGNLAVPGIEGNDDVPLECSAGLLQEPRGLHRGSADDDVADAGVDVGLDGVEIADAAAQLYRQIAADRPDDGLDRRLVLGPAGRCAVEIDHVQAARALVQPLPGHRAGVLGKYR